MSRILFVCPDLDQPAGGIKQIYRQVDVLNQLGYKAYVLHGQKNFRVTWFKNSTPVLWDYRVSKIDAIRTRITIHSAIQKIKNFKIKKKAKVVLDISDKDTIVLPEFYGKDLEDAFADYTTIVYNQNCYYSFRGYNYSDNIDNSIYNQNRLKAVIVASEDAKRYMNTFSNKPLFRVKYGIDSSVFNYNKNKKRQIAYMPRKLREDAIQVFNILHHNKALNGWDIAPISGLNESEVAKILGESAVFLSFNHREGFGMPPAEAMACGCVVVGYQGQGGREIFKPEFSYPVYDRDITAFVETLQEVLRLFDDDNDEFLAKGKSASEFINKNYDMQAEKDTIKNAWSEIIKFSNK